MKQIFTISGLAQHGKDSTASFLKEKLNGKSLVLHNADFLKYIAEKYMGWNGAKDNYGRDLLQWLGTDRVRVELNKPLFWIEKSCDAIEILQDKYDYFFISDTRFINEVRYPQARFPHLVTSVHVTRLNFDNGLTEQQKNHPSETSLNGFKFDYKIVSESGLDKLEVEVDKFIKLYKTNKMDIL